MVGYHEKKRIRLENKNNCSINVHEKEKNGVSRYFYFHRFWHEVKNGLFSLSVGKLFVDINLKNHRSH